MHFIPQVKKQEIKSGYLRCKAIRYDKDTYDSRIQNALMKLPYDDEGVALTIEVTGNKGEGYELWIHEDSIEIKANSLAGAFYGIQTLRQAFTNEQIPCAYIQDDPDFPYRGFYHDVTRGKVPKVETIKQLIDEMAYYKMNSLQLYVEHTYEFVEYKELNERTGYLTGEDLRELDGYCKERFIDFIPSLSTFGHLFELLNQEKYKHLRVREEAQFQHNFWANRMCHHTIDPLQEESFEIIKSLIDQFGANFTSEYFNICCDETFDLKNYPDPSIDTGKLYIDFVKKIIGYLQSKGKKVMMWADILLEHPEIIEELPEDVILLNWEYSELPEEERIRKIAKLGRTQMVCPGIQAWNRFCERITSAEKNISNMAEFGRTYGAGGILNTNWGDWGHQNSIELSMYGMVFGAAKSWNLDTTADDTYYQSLNQFLYKNAKGVQMVKRVSDMQYMYHWTHLIMLYYQMRYNEPMAYQSGNMTKEIVKKLQEVFLELKAELQDDIWSRDEFRQEILLAAEGSCIAAELQAGLQNVSVERVTDTKQWLRKFREKWLQKNKPSELHKLEKFFHECENFILNR